MRVTQSFEDWMVTFVQKTVRRFLRDEDIHVPPELYELERRDPRLAEIGMAVRIREGIDRYLYEVIVFGVIEKDRVPPLLTEVTGETHPPLLTWKDIGEALGVSAQAANRKVWPQPKESARAEGYQPLSAAQRTRLSPAHRAGAPILRACHRPPRTVSSPGRLGG